MPHILSLLVLTLLCVQVTAGTVSFSAPVIIKATSTGTESTLAGIARLVAEAQSREVPLQRVADTVAGRFCYGVMATAAATFAFWSLLGEACCCHRSHAAARASIVLQGRAARKQ